MRVASVSFSLATLLLAVLLVLLALVMVEESVKDLIKILIRKYGMKGVDCILLLLGFHVG